MAPQDKVEQLLREVGAVPLKTNKHRKVRLPNGRVFTMAATPSDHRAWANAYSDLKRMLGITNEPKEPVVRVERRKKQRCVHPTRFVSTAPARPVADFRHQLVHALGGPAFESLMMAQGTKRIA